MNVMRFINEQWYEQMHIKDEKQVKSTKKIKKKGEKYNHKMASVMCCNNVVK